MELNAAEPELIPADYNGIISEFQQIICETGREFSQMSSNERQAIITETFNFGEKCKGEKAQRLFRLTGEWFLELHNRILKGNLMFR